MSNEQAPPVDPPTVEHVWLTPEATALVDAGYQVTVYPRGIPSAVALLDVGPHHVRVHLSLYWLVEQQRSEDDGRRVLVNEWWPADAAAAVALAVELAGDLKEAHEAEQEQAVIGDEILAAHDAEIPADVAGAA